MDRITLRRLHRPSLKARQLASVAPAAIWRAGWAGEGEHETFDAFALKEDCDAAARLAFKAWPIREKAAKLAELQTQLNEAANGGA